MAGYSVKKGVRSPIRSTTVAAADRPPSGERLAIAGSDGWYDVSSAGAVQRMGTVTNIGTVSPQAYVAANPGYTPFPGDIYIWVNTDANTISSYRFQ